jgi:hypothetical protein
MEYSMSVAEGKSRGTRSTGRLSGSLALLLFILALVLLSLHFVSYGQAKAFFDQHVATHIVLRHDKGYLTEQDHDRLISHLPIAAGIVGFSALTLILFKQKLNYFLVGIPGEWREIHVLSFHRFCQSIETRLEMGDVFIVFAIGVFLRLWHIGRAIRFDEAWTYVEFGSKPLVLGLSNYRAPNNHLLNTLLVHFSTSLLAIRFSDSAFRHCSRDVSWSSPRGW